MSNYKKSKNVQVVELPPTQSQQPLAARGLRVADVANYTGATVCMVRAAIKAKTLQAMRLGKRDIVLRESADAWLNSLKAGQS